MSSNYPGGVDSYVTHSDITGEIIHASTTNDIQDAIVAVETELGVNPSGTFPTVAARLGDVDSRIAGGGGGGGGGSTTATGVPTVINVKDATYGVKGDAKDLTDAVISAGTATLTSASAPFASGDVGKLMYVYGAGVSGALLATTISRYTSATQVTLAVTASTTVSGALATYGTNDTTAWSNAINATKAAGVPGTVFLPAGTSLVTTALPSLNGTRDVTLAGGGAAGMSYATYSTTPARPRAELRYMGSGPDTFLNVGTSKGFTVERLAITYGHPLYIGTLINLASTWTTKFRQSLFGGAVTPAFGATLFGMANQVEAYFEDCLFERATLGFAGGGHYCNANTWVNCIFLALRTCANNLFYQNTFNGCVWEPANDASGGDPTGAPSSITGSSEGLAFYGCGWWDANASGYWIDVTVAGLTISGGYWEPQGASGEGLVRLNGVSDAVSIGGGLRAAGRNGSTGSKVLTLAGGASVTNLDFGAVSMVNTVDGLSSLPSGQAVTFLGRQGASAAFAHGNGGASKTLTRHAVQTLTLNSSTCTLTLPTVASSAATELELLLKQDTTGSRLVTWPAAIRWPSNNTAPTLATGAGSVDVVKLVTLDGTTWLGRVLASYPTSAPAAPASVTATPSTTAVALAWAAPNDGGSAITDYVVQYRTTTGPGSWTTFTDGVSSATGATVTGLAATTSYDFQVAAVNAVGTSAYSSPVTATTANTAFDPGSIAWVAAYWTEDASWTPPANGGGVTSWRDFSGHGLTASAYTVAPTYQASNSGLNGKPTVNFVESSLQALRTSGANFLQVQPFTVFAVLADWNAASGVTQGELISSNVAGAPQILSGTTSIAGIYAGSNIGRAPTPQASTGAHCWAFLVNGASSKIVKDGTSANVDANPGGNYYGGSGYEIAIANRGGGENGGTGLYGSAQIAFIGIYNGDLTSDSNWTSLKSWAASHYGLTIA